MNANLEEVFPQAAKPEAAYNSPLAMKILELIPDQKLTFALILSVKNESVYDRISSGKQGFNSSLHYLLQAFMTNFWLEVTGNVLQRGRRRSESWSEECCFAL
jgi:hypothetical protein